jgi:hypothetical protein
MKRYYFNERNGDATLLFDAEDEQQARQRAFDLLKNPRGFRMEEGEEDDVE